MDEITCPELVLRAYQEGFFPMAESEGGEIYWHSPDPRAVFPLFRITVPRSMRQKMKKGVFTFKVNSNFRTIIQKCAQRESTWISPDIINAYCELHDMGYAHSVEAYHDGELVGGLYGMAIGGAFFGESMFNIMPDAAKASFYYLVERLKARDYILLDSQYLNPFTQQLGAIEISREIYLYMLSRALEMDCKFGDKNETK